MDKNKKIQIGLIVVLSVAIILLSIWIGHMLYPVIFPGCGTC